MPKFVVEREIPGVGDWSAEQLVAASRTSNGVLREMGPEIQWVQTHVAGDKMYCVYIAPDVETVREHARKADFPANRVSQIAATIDPTTGER